MKPNTWAMLCHLCGLIGYLGNALGSIIGPLIVWIVKKDSIPEVDRHGKEALNFNISVTIYGLVLAAFAFATCGAGVVVSVPLAVVLVVFHLVSVILAAIKANNGEEYRYPFCLRLLK